MFGDKQTERLYDGRRVARWKSFEALARRKLEQVIAAAELRDLGSPPGNRLEKLKGSLKGYWSVRINDQWRIIFRWARGGATDIRIVDYH